MPRARRTSIEGSEEPKGMGGGIAVLIVLIIIGAVIVSLLSGGPESQAPQDSEDVVKMSLEQLNNINKESFTFSGGLEAEVNDYYQGVAFSGKGEIDSENKKMHFDLSLDSDTFKDGGVDLQTYTIDDSIYINFQNTWTKESVSAFNWDNSLMSTKVMQFVDNFDASPAKIETISGKSAYRIDIKPAMSEIFMLMQSVNPSALQGMGITSASGFGQGIKNIEVSVWVDTETMLPIKMELIMEAQTASLNQETGAGIKTSDMIISAIIDFNYSDNINIVLPAAAQTAV